jgi:hypothetical protein
VRVAAWGGMRAVVCGMARCFRAPSSGRALTYDGLWFDPCLARRCRESRRESHQESPGEAGGCTWFGAQRCVRTRTNKMCAAVPLRGAVAVLLRLDFLRPRLLSGSSGALATLRRRFGRLERRDETLHVSAPLEEQGAMKCHLHASGVGRSVCSKHPAGRSPDQWAAELGRF